MIADLPIELRRARPLLGTLVEITARGSCENALARAVNSAFAAVARVDQLMSFHRSGSDVGRVNRLAHRVPVRVHPWTWHVLWAAQRLSKATAGIFDITVGGELARLGYLPSPVSMRADRRACWSDIVLLPGKRVRFARPLLIDLGGIAKGFAVDRAVDRLRVNGVSAGLVNAGGDLRAYGTRRWRVHVRHPANPGRLVPLFDVERGALATSAVYFARRRFRGRAVTPVVDPARRRALNPSFSVSVAASNCVLADALTKLALLRGPRALGLVSRLGGRAYILDASTAGLGLGQSAAEQETA